jgi:HEAT repeat protein
MPSDDWPPISASHHHFPEEGKAFPCWWLKTSWWEEALIALKIVPVLILFPPFLFPTSAAAILGRRVEKRRLKVQELGNLAHIGDARAIRALAASCLDPTFTDIATEQLVRSSPNAIPFLLASLSDRKVRVRGGAAYALGRIGPEASDAIPGLSDALRDQDVRVQITAADSLQRVDPGTRKTIPYLVPWLAHVDPYVRRGRGTQQGPAHC